MFGFITSALQFIPNLISAYQENGDLRRQVQTQQGNISTLETIIKDKEARIEGLSLECEKLKIELIETQEDRAYQLGRKEFYKGEVKKANGFLERWRKHCATLNKQIRTQEEQLALIANQDGKFWELPPRETPPFRPHGHKTATIIAVTNLKGGVGKTTITANLGGTLCSLGKRVLLIDLDHQHNLTNLTLEVPEQQQLDLSGNYIDKVFQQPQMPCDAFCGLWTKFMDRGHIVATREELANVEEHVKAQWLLNQASFDARYMLRRLVHMSAVQQHFDYILIDCPPRLTLASVNALTCADFVLVPVKLDKTSTSAVPRLLQWFQKLKDQSVAPALEILGVVANETFYSDKFSKKEQNILSNLKQECGDVLGDPVHFFGRGIPRKAIFAQAAQSKELAALEPELKSVFVQFAEEVQNECKPAARVAS